MALSRRLSSLLLSALLLLAVSAGVQAHGGGAAQLSNEPLGPYLLSVWTNPDPPVVGALHVTVALAAVDTGEPITSAAVKVVASSTTAATPITVEASPEGALVPYFYEADLQFPAAGVWQIDILVEDEAGANQAGFVLTVRETGMPWLLIGIAGVIVLGGGWLLWLFLRGGSSPDSRKAPRQRGAHSEKKPDLTETRAGREW